jgi:hypothetical protein
VTDVIFPPVPRRAYGVGVSSLERRRSVLDRLDDGLLVIVALVGVVILFSVVGWVIHTVLFFVKVALVAVFIGLIVRLVARRR